MLRYSQFLQSLSPSPLASAQPISVASHESAVIQLADVLAGFNRLATEIALGRENKQILVRDDALNDNIPINLLNYISIALRWEMWGKVPPPRDPDNISFDGTWPFKRVGGFGLRIQSSIPLGTIEKIYDSRVVHMGCMH